MNPSDLKHLRRMASELFLPTTVVDDAVECGLFVAEPALSDAQAGEVSLEAHRRTLRQLRRLMDDLGVNAPGAALLVRMRLDVDALRREVNRLRRLEAQYFDDWHDALWYDLDGM